MTEYTGEENIRIISENTFEVDSKTTKRYYWSYLDRGRKNGRIWLVELRSSSNKEEVVTYCDELVLCVPNMAIVEPGDRKKTDRLYCVIDTPVNVIRYPLPVIRFDGETDLEKMLKLAVCNQ